MLAASTSTYLQPFSCRIVSKEICFFEVCLWKCLASLEALIASRSPQSLDPDLKEYLRSVCPQRVSLAAQLPLFTVLALGLQAADSK